MLHLNHLFTCYAADVVTKYAFDKSYDFLHEPNFQSPFTVAVRGFKDIVHPCAQFYWLPRIIMLLPDSWITILQPPMAAVINFQKVRTLVGPRRYDVDGNVGNEESDKGRQVRNGS